MNMLRHRRLRNMQGLRGAGVVHQPARRQKSFHSVILHHITHYQTIYNFFLLFYHNISFLIYQYQWYDGALKDVIFYEMV